MTDNKSGFTTNTIHGHYDPTAERGALVPPVYMTSTFAFESAEQGGARFSGDEAGYIYSRISNPTLDLLEKRLAQLEGAEAGVAFGSGMGAICSVLWTLLESGDEILVDKTLYGCTFSFIHHGLTKFGITIKYADMCNVDDVAAAITNKTRLIYFETPANPNMRLVDINAIATIAKNKGVLTIVDNTYATPYLTQPIELGIDIVVHSATKYLGGHGDLIAGMAVGSAELMERVRLEGLKDMTGSVMAPLTAFQILRGMKTLSLRMDKHCSNAQVVAEFLQEHLAVKQVFYPGLESFDQFELAQKQMRQPGGMIAFELEGGIEAGKKMINNLSLIKCAVSLGDSETLIQHPASMTHSTYSEEQQLEHGITLGLIRLSVGLEDSADIIEDLLHGLEGANRQVPCVAVS